MDLPTYTSIWRIEKRLYKLYDLRLPMPLPVGQIAVFAAIAVPYVILLTIFGLSFNHTLFWLYVLPPGVLTWLATRPVLESKRLPELIISQVRYLGEPRTWCRLAPLAEPDEVQVAARVWRRSVPVTAELAQPSRQPLPKAQESLPKAQESLPKAQESLPEAQRDLPERQQGLPERQRGLRERQRGLAAGQRALRRPRPALPEARQAAAKARRPQPQDGRLQPDGGRAQPDGGRPQPERGRGQPEPGRVQPERGRAQPEPGLGQPHADPGGGSRPQPAVRRPAQPPAPAPAPRRRAAFPLPGPSPLPDSARPAYPPPSPEGRPAAGPVRRPAAAEPARPAAGASAAPAPAAAGPPAPGAAPPAPAAAPPAPGAGESAPVAGPPAHAAPAAPQQDAAGTAAPATSSPGGPPAQPVPAPRPVRIVSAGSAAVRPGRQVERALSGPADQRSTSWRDHVTVVPGGRGPGQADQVQRERIRAAAQLDGPRLVVVLGCTVGAGQTVTALMLADLLARLRSEPVAALDLNPGPASLAEQAQSPPAATVSAVLSARETGRQAGHFGGRGRGRLDVIAEELPADGARPAGDLDHRRLFGLLASRYPLVITDPGAAAVSRVLSAADQLILVAPASPDAGRATAMTLEWLDANGHTTLIGGSVAVMNGVSKRSAGHAEQAEAVVRGRCRAIVRVPWDDRLGEPPAEQGIRGLQSGPGSRLDHLRPAVLDAYTALAGVVVSGLTAAPPSGKAAP